MKGFHAVCRCCDGNDRPHLLFAASAATDDNDDAMDPRQTHPVVLLFIGTVCHLSTVCARKSVAMATTHLRLTIKTKL